MDLLQCKPTLYKLS